MDLVTADTLKELIDQEEGPLVSLYLPTHRKGAETRQDPIRLKNVLDEAQHWLAGSGLRTPEVEEVLAPIVALVDDFDFWQHQEEGLALFTSGRGLRSLRVPVDVPEVAIVTDRFHVKPLWPVLHGTDQMVHVLALSRNQVRLLWSTRYEVGEVDLPSDLPQSLADALWFEDPESQLQHHGSGRAGAGRVTATFHGQGQPSADEEDRLERFLRAVDKGLTHILESDAPLLLAGVEEVTAVFRKVGGHKNILEDTIEGNPDHLESHQLHEKLLPCIEPLLDQTYRSDAEAFHAAGDQASSGISDVTQAAREGRIDAVFVQADTFLWGRVGDSGVEVHDDREAGDCDLFDRVAAMVWTQGGRVHAVPGPDIPGIGDVAALLRW